MGIDPIVTALAQQQDELSGLLAGLSDDDWALPSRCDGWSVSDVVLHLAQTHEMALASLQGTLAEAATKIGSGVTGSSVDEMADGAVARERGAPTAAIRDRWTADADAVRSAFESFDLSTRVQWVAGELSARTLATTRLAETWIHTGDIAERGWPRRGFTLAISPRPSASYSSPPTVCVTSPALRGGRCHTRLPGRAGG